MKAPHQLLREAAQADPQGFKQICATARNLSQDPAFCRLKRFLDGMVDLDGLSFAATAGAPSIDPLLAALREGSKIYPRLIEQLSAAGEVSNPHDGNAGVEVEGKPYQPTE